MPQASQELRAEMERRFGDPIDDSAPIGFLEERGYTLLRNWTWSKPGIESLRQMERDEFDCLLFLVHEWDFGGLSPASAIEAPSGVETGNTGSTEGESPAAEGGDGR